MAGVCEFRNKPSLSIICEEFLDYRRTCQAPTKDSTFFLGLHRNFRSSLGLGDGNVDWGSKRPSG